MMSFWKSWDFLRVLRLALGLYILIQGIIDVDWFFIFLGAAFSAMPLFNIGCCASGSCNTRMPKNQQNTEEISYEEIR